MSVPDDHSYFPRFLLKFVEIIAAGLATAASGYLIAHLSGAQRSQGYWRCLSLNQRCEPAHRFHKLFVVEQKI